MLAVVTAGCTGAPDTKQPFHITDLLLRPEEKPKGTILDAGDSGPQTLEQYAGNDPMKKREMSEAGFVTSWFELFISREAISSQKLTGSSVLAISFALEFTDASGASKGLGALQRGVTREGSNVRALPNPPGFGDAAIELSGTLQKGRPPGFIIAWTYRKWVLGLIAVGAPGAIDEKAARTLAGVMAAHSSG